MLPYATAMAERTADPEAILHRFTRSNVQHPTYKALAELGKAVKTVFLCRYLGDEALRREIHEGLNVVETWNSANGFIFFGKGGEVASNRLDDQEVSVHALHLLQSCLVYVNTLMLQQVLADPAWMARMTSADIRGLTPLVWGYVSPYGTFDSTWEPGLTSIGGRPLEHGRLFTEGAFCQTSADRAPPVAAETGRRMVSPGGERPSAFWWSRTP